MDAMLSAAAFTGLSQWVLYSFKKKKKLLSFYNIPCTYSRKHNEEVKLKCEL